MLGLQLVSCEGPAKSYWVEKSAEGDQKQSSDILRLNEMFTTLAEKSSPTVVNIYVKVKIASRKKFGQDPRGQTPEDLFRFFFGNPFERPFEMPMPREAQAMGSGFVINSDGYIVTNSHVIRNGDQVADEIMVKFIGGDRNKGYEAEVIGFDKATDVALLKLKNPKKELLNPAPLGDSDKLKVGHWVIAIGNPYGHSHTVTQGIVSALGRNVEDLRTEFIQTSASINLGNSGGPLINLNGEVIGINTAIDPRAQGIGFAIPINRAKSVIRQLIEKGKVVRGWMGVGIAEVTPQLAQYLKLPEQKGVLIQEVFPGEPADKAGIKVYDVVVKVNDREVNTPQELAILVGDIPVGDSVNLEVYRDGAKRSLKVKITQRKAEDETPPKLGDMPDKGGAKKVDMSEKVGMVLVGLNDSLRENLGLPKNVIGVVVKETRPYGVADQAGISAGDVITEINRSPVKTLEQAEQQIKKSFDEKGQLLLKIQRKSGTAVVLLDLSNEGK